MHHIDAFAKITFCLRRFHSFGLLTTSHCQLTLSEITYFFFRNIIHQLCRVLTILNAEPGQITMPGDGEALLNWAEQILQKYVHVQHTTTELEDNSRNDALATNVIRPDQHCVPNGDLNRPPPQNRIR